MSPSRSPATHPSPSDPSSSLINPIPHRTIAIPDIDDHDDKANRLDPDPETIKTLALSIAAVGLINPITVTAHGSRYQLVAGRRRLAAFRHLGRHWIWATVLTDHHHQAPEIKLAENVARSNLTPVEEAMQLAPLVAANPNGVDGVAVATGRTVKWILDRLEICDWPESLQVHVHNRKINLAAAKRLARIQPPDLRETRIHQAALHGITAQTAALWVQDALATQAPVSEVSEKSHFYEGPAYETETRVQCFICREPAKIEDTVPTRVCNPCLIKLEHAASQQNAEPPR